MGIHKNNIYLGAALCDMFADNQPDFSAGTGIWYAFQIVKACGKNHFLYAYDDVDGCGGLALAINF